MKNITLLLALFALIFGFNSCRKIKYEEGDKLPRRKFLETINGVWTIKHAYSSIDANTYTEDSVPFWNTRFAGEGKLIIDYYNTITFKYGNHINYSYFSQEKEEVGYQGFLAYPDLNKRNDNDTAFNIFSQKIPYRSNVLILKLDKENLILAHYETHGDRLELVKN
jgi:hypothetical protein